MPWVEIVDQADREAREPLQQLEGTCMHLVRQFQTYGQGWPEAGDKLTMVVARAMRLKWQLMCYRPVDKDIC